MENEFHSVPPPPPPRPPSEFHPIPLYTRTPVEFHGTNPNPHANNAAGPSAYPHHLASSYLSHPHPHLQHHQLPMVYTANPPQHPSISPTNTYHHIYHHTPPDNKRRRGRLATACVNCNRRKQRCDGEVPCGLCVKRNVPCSYPTEMNTSYNADAERARQAGAMASSSASPTRQPSKKARISVGGVDVARLSDASHNGKGKAKERNGEDIVIAERVGRGSSLPSQIIGHRQQPEGAPSNPIRVPTSAQSSNLPLPIASHPISSERSNPILPRVDQAQASNQQDPESSLGRFWRSYTDLRPSISPLPSSTGIGAGTRGGGGSNEKDETCSSSASEKLMEENEAYGVGSLRTHTGPWDEGKGEKTFFGTSHFGPQLAAKVIRGMPTVPLADVRHAPYRGASRLDGVKPYTLESQTRELVIYLPEREECDQYVRRFFDRYNSHNDILYQPDFMVAYHRFWNDYNIKQSSQVDLRYLGLLLIVLALGVLLDHDPSEKVKRQTQLGDLKLSEEQKVIIEGMMGQLERQTMSLKDREEKSSKWSWAAKRALLESSSFFGESMDTVRAGLLIALYLNVCRRVPEAWTAIGTAIRAAQAQGLHVDGSSWKGMSTKEAELRRRLWAQLYAVDRSIALFLGRPVCIQDGEFTTREPANMHDDELEMPATFPRGLNIPTKSTFLILHYRLNKIIGKVQLTCFNLNPRRYADIQECEEMFQSFKNSLPPHFRLDRHGTDFSLDDQRGYSWLPIQRQTLNAKFHLARISLHRPYLLRSLGKGKGKKLNPYIRSRDALLNSATADLRLRFTFNELDPLDRFKWMTVASGFNSATILGILCHLGYKDVQFPKGSLRSMIQAYIALEEKTIRRDEALETELMVLKMMEARALAREEMESRSGRTTPGSYGSGGGATDPKLLVQIQMNQGRFGPSQQDHSRATSLGTGEYPTVGEGMGMGMDVNVSHDIWQTSSGSGGLAHGNHEEVNPNSSMKLSDRLEHDNEPSSQQPFERDVNVNYDTTNIPLPTPIPHSLSTPSLSTALGLPNYNVYNPNPNTNSDQNQNEWYLPSDWDPTTSGLPDSSDPSAWQALLGMDWMNNLDLDMGFDMREVGMVGDEHAENGVVGITEDGDAGGGHNGWREN
ncbi:hypothetical protein I302_107786 [Kwoniella bestiolae CBS 10118]|uniref:Zn(2)-C6 fungal-type domain-containing protein n=1 Tax=Kwoniella bestiolae CBS 10118 TaxID=1296100 RepID=A0A1B9FXI8_9TREE|nr:hypothetical protein I302_06476 [Kwoniella bestiolae CBS 10118]OCF23493.1 hypothetical protein I302_06476 [Kwoniella bestiolae CBS 10118]